MAEVALTRIEKCHEWCGTSTGQGDGGRLVACSTCQRWYCAGWCFSDHRMAPGADERPWWLRQLRRLLKVRDEEVARRG